MELAHFALRFKTVTLVFALLVATMGSLSYLELGRLEDPEFTIKKAIITTQYPGATAQEVEQEVSEPLETAIQQLKQLKKVTSISRSGMSIIFAEIQDSFNGDTLPQVWDELRRKIHDTTGSLPSGCGTPEVNDDFGDVYGVFLALTGDGYTPHELRQVAKDLRRELLLCDEVGRIDFWGVQTEAVYVEIDRARLARLGITPTTIFNTINAQNTVTSAGDVQVEPEDVRIRVTGGFSTIDDMKELLIPAGADSDGASRMIRLKDLATVERGYLDPPTRVLLFNGKPAVGIGISTVKNGNVVTMGRAVRQRMEQLTPNIPVGMNLETIAFQSETVERAVSGFVLNLIESVAIVIALLMLFMGLREGLIMAVVLLLTILGTFVCMKVLHVSLERASLGALIIALGMLVDNAIVVTEGIVIKSLRGMPREDAALETVREVQWPLLGATAIAILAFAAISMSNDKSGEYLQSLFKVIAVSLGLSWVFAVTVTPWLCVTFLKSPKKPTEVYGNPFYHAYRTVLGLCIRHRPITLTLVCAMLAASLYGNTLIHQNFFPDSTRPQFTLDVWFPAGTHIATTQERLTEVGAYIRTLPGVTATTTFVGSGAMRFILTYDPEMPDACYGQILTTVDTYEAIAPLRAKVEAYMASHRPEAVHSLQPFKLGPGGGAIEARLSGHDPLTLYELGDKVMHIMRAEPTACSIRSDWEQRVKTLEVRMAEAPSRGTGVTRPDIGEALAMNFSGLRAGVYRDGDILLPIMLRPPKAQRKGVDNLDDVQVWSSAMGTSLPIGQVTQGVRTVWEDPVINRRNRMRTLTASCWPHTGTAMTVLGKLRPKIEAIPLPEGYRLEWGGEYENSRDATDMLMANVPLSFAVMFFISVALFNSIRQPVIIFLGLPLALIGVVSGLLATDAPFGFMSLLGFLSLSGMLMKNEIVLLDQINLERATGKGHFQAVVDASVSRVRPVCMAAFTTVLGMAPLLWDVFFNAMAVTIMAGLTFATVLTLLVTPVLYTLFFRVREERA
ncbi:MAG: efflux RND transporter permease subunit [Desulfovibrionaceae bacterium]